MESIHIVNSQGVYNKPINSKKKINLLLQNNKPYNLITVESVVDCI